MLSTPDQRTLEPGFADPGMHWVAAMALTALAYAVAGSLALLLAIPPSYASPLYPAAGVALASTLVYGWRMLPGVALGSFAVNVTLSLQRGNVDLASVAVPLVIGIAAALQAFVGAALVRRHVRQPLVLTEPRDIALFFGLGAMVGCLVGASISTATLVWVGTVPAASASLTWVTWWAGDALGALIAAPITLTLIGRPRSLWSSRRITVGLALGIATALLVLAISLVARWDEQRVRAAFERDATNLSYTLEARLQEPLDALDALHGVFISSSDVTRHEMRQATQSWLKPGRLLQAMGWSEHVRRDGASALEARARAEGQTDYRVFDRPAAQPAPATANGVDGVVAIRYIEPEAENKAALGVNTLSVPQARAAIEASTAHDTATASAGFLLTQRDPADKRVGVVLYRAVYAGTPATPEQRRNALRGMVFVTLVPSRILDSLATQMPAYLQPCLVDMEPQSAPQRLAGAAGCESAGGELQHARSFNFGGRRWDLRVAAGRAAVPEVQGANAWLFSLVGLLAAAMLGALLLTVTGRTRRIEAAVRLRTAELVAEVRERQHAEAAMRESDLRFRTILGNVPIGVTYCDLQGNIEQTNARMAELTGYSEAELCGMNWRDFSHPEDSQRDLALARQLASGEVSVVRLDRRYITKDGRTLWVQATASLLRDAQGEPKRILCVVEDSSERMRLQDAERARELAEAANRAKSEFLSRMSHELRTPLNAMLGFAQLLELDTRQPLTPSQQPWVAQIQQAGWHLLEMINDVLDLSRIESGNLRLQTDPLDLVELVSASVAMVAADAQRRDVTISTDLASGSASVLGDATRVKQILVNLLSNAVKYNTDGGRVHVASRVRSPDGVEIAVTDTGMGMSTQQLADLFQPFNRLGRERSAQEGTGIGLVISRRLAELMGGSLRARSSEGEGSSFILALPLVIDADTVRSDLDMLAPEQPEYHQRLVHYVEDNETNVEVMRGILAQRPQVQMDVSITGLAGLAAIRTTLPDLVLLDMHLPDISGLELLRHLQANEATAHIPVVVVSADALTTETQAAMAAGAVRYLTKPVSVAEVLGVIDNLLDGVPTNFG